MLLIDKIVLCIKVSLILGSIIAVICIISFVLVQFAIVRYKT